MSEIKLEDDNYLHAVKRIKAAYKHKLDVVNLANLNLTKLPKEIEKLTHLKRLYIYNNAFESLPPSIRELKELVILDVSRNFLESIPNEISELSSLVSLNISSNKLTYIPSQIKSLTELQLFDITNNSISYLPNELKELSKLKHLYAKGNDIENVPPEIIAQGGVSIVNFFQEQVDEGIDKLYEAKIVLIGEPGAGKTTLARKIINPKYILQDEFSTRGIDVAKWSFPTNRGKTFSVNIWDFGGQEIYKATHQFFLTKRTLYVLVADSRKEDTDFYYWLHITELLSDKSPLIVVLNEKQDRSRQIDELQLKGIFSNFKATIPSNLETNRGLEKILDSIKHYIQSLKHVGSELPKTWIAVRHKLEEIQENYISLQTYIDLCKQNAIETKERALFLSEYLHDLGVFLHFQENHLLRNFIILNPEWSTNATYKLLEDPQIVANNGRFNKKNLTETVWSESEYADAIDELLELMMKFEFCYNLKGTKNYIIPQLLPISKPKYSWPESNNLVIRYEYSFLPKGIVSRLIVRLHKYIKRNKVWRNGVVLEKSASQAEIIEYYSKLEGKKEIQIKVTGFERKDLLSIIMYELDQINDSFSDKLSVNKWVRCICSKCKELDMPHFFKYEYLVRRKQAEKKYIECEISFEELVLANVLEGVSESKEAIRFKLNEVKEAIVQNKTTEALDILDKLTSNMVDHNNEVTMLKSRFNKNTLDKINGIINEKEQNLELNNINFSILTLISKIDQK